MTARTALQGDPVDPTETVAGVVHSGAGEASAGVPDVGTLALSMVVLALLGLYGLLVVYEAITATPEWIAREDG